MPIHCNLLLHSCIPLNIVSSDTANSHHIPALSYLTFLYLPTPNSLTQHFSHLCKTCTDTAIHYCNSTFFTLQSALTLQTVTSFLHFLTTHSPHFSHLNSLTQHSSHLRNTRHTPHNYVPHLTQLVSLLLITSSCVSSHSSKPSH